ncbi:MAG: hypothetical protein JSU05_14490, partial [Bacteroidetes bacterium]|nr:hypothetical protein [Bacteroidota bacterium]
MKPRLWMLALLAFITALLAFSFKKPSSNKNALVSLEQFKKNYVVRCGP